MQADKIDLSFVVCMKTDANDRENMIKASINTGRGGKKYYDRGSLSSLYMENCLDN